MRPIRVAAATGDADLAGLLTSDPAPGPDGWKRVVLGLAVGLLGGALIGLLLPRGDGPRRSAR